MPYRLGDGVWVEYQASRVRAVLMNNMDPDRTYTVAELLQLLKDLGLDYSNPAYQQIGALLVAEGFLEQT